MDLPTLKKLHDKAYLANQDTRENASDDLSFYWVSQWDDRLLNDSQLAYKGEFNILRKAGRQIMSDLRANPVQVDFEPKDTSRKDAGDILDGIYRSVDRDNSSIEAYENAANEMVVCGFGAWQLVTEYESLRNGDEKQVIKRYPITEANNKVFFDPNAKLLDKSDAKYCSVLHNYTADGYKELVADIKGIDEDEVSTASFSYPQQSYTFPWYSQNEQVYIVDFYFREKVKDKVYTMLDPFGSQIQVLLSEMSTVMDDMIDEGYMIVSEKQIERFEVTKYIASGDEILLEEVIPGGEIPIVPAFGEHAHVESQEIWQGVTRLAKDPQRLRNFQMSYLADIVSRSPRVKPIFTQDQIQGYEWMYEENGADNNYPYYLQQRKDAAGMDLPVGPVATMPEQPIPTALGASIDLSRQAVDDVASPGIPQDIADPDLSGKAVIALQNRMDQQSMVYQDHSKHAKRRDGVIFSAMAASIYVQPQEVKLTLPNGESKTVEMMQQIIDEETGELKTINDVGSIEFDVYSDIGQSYSTTRQQTREELVTLMQGMAPGDPMREALMLKYIQLVDGQDFEDIRTYASNQLILRGIKEPETEEEMQLLAESQQSQQPDANTLLAMAEMKKGDAALMREQREMVKTESDIINDRAGTAIDAFEAQTDRINTQIDAQKASAEINYKRLDLLGKQADRSAKQRDQLMSRVQTRFAQ